MYAKILAVCGLVLLMAVAIFQCYTDYIIFYRSVYAKILAVCGLVLESAVAMFKCYTDYIIFIAVCMLRSWQYAAWSC